MLFSLFFFLGFRSDTEARVPLRKKKIVNNEIPQFSSVSEAPRLVKVLWGFAEIALV